MKRFRFVLLCIFSLFLMSIISSCGVSEQRKNMYNDNSKIAEEGDSFTYKTRTDIEDSNDKINVKYSGFYGTDSIWTFESKENGEITFKYNSMVNSGDFKAVLINPGKEIENILSGSQQGDKTVKLTKGRYIFKIVGRNAKGQIKVFICESQNVEITKSKS